MDDILRSKSKEELINLIILSHHYFTGYDDEYDNNKLGEFSFDELIEWIEQHEYGYVIENQIDIINKFNNEKELKKDYIDLLINFLKKNKKLINILDFEYFTSSGQNFYLTISNILKNSEKQFIGLIEYRSRSNIVNTMDVENCRLYFDNNEPQNLELTKELVNILNLIDCFYFLEDPNWGTYFMHTIDNIIDGMNLCIYNPFYENDELITN